MAVLLPLRRSIDVLFMPLLLLLLSDSSLFCELGGVMT
jgi:hypothetical protein